jgi:hypothetical protein
MVALALCVSALLAGLIADVVKPSGHGSPSLRIIEGMQRPVLLGYLLAGVRYVLFLWLAIRATACAQQPPV